MDDIDRTMIKIVLAIFVGVPALVVGGCMSLASISYSDGERVGELIKISEKGVLFSTWEAQLKLTEAGELWDFSCEVHDELVPVLQQSLGKRLRVQYHQTVGWVPWKGGTNYQATEVVEEPR